VFFLFALHLQPALDPNRLARSLAQTFAELYEQYLPRVFRYVSYRVDDTQAAEDLTSTVFEKALTKFSDYRPEKAAFSTWIFTIARNTLIDHLRRRGQHPSVKIEDAGPIADGAPLPEDAAIQSEEQNKLHVCLSKLTNVEQNIISRKFGMEMTNREIAKDLGLSESNVGVILYRAVRKLRDEFGDAAHD